MTPHAYRKNSIQGIILALIATVILMAAMGCKKEVARNGLDPKPADIKTREWLKRMAYPNHGESCDTTLHGKY